MADEENKSVESIFDAIEKKIAEGEQYGAKSEPEGSVGSLDADLLNVSFDSLQSKRERKKIPDQWTRILVVGNELIEAVKIYPINTDLLVDQGTIYVPPARRTEPQWQPIFHTTAWKNEHPDQTFENTRLSEFKLMQYGKKITKLRAEIRKRAGELLTADRNSDAVDMQAVKNLSARMNRGYFSKKS